MVEAYPLYWPKGWKRTPQYSRKRNYQFTQSFAANRDGLMAELKKLGARNIVLSTNIPLRNDGLPKAGTRKPEDPGVAVYFEYKKNSMCFACDKYSEIAENVRAISLTIGAIRGIERWGASDMMDRAFQGFTALPAPEDINWRAILGFKPGDMPSEAELRSAYKKKALVMHPDQGGSATEFHILQSALEQASRESK